MSVFRFFLRLTFVIIFVVYVEVRWKEALLFISFMNKIVNSCDLVVLIIINTFFGEI